MENRRYLVDEQPYLFSFMDILRENMTEDIHEQRLINLARVLIDKKYWEKRINDKDIKEQLEWIYQLYYSRAQTSRSFVDE